jgi:hypothetical protein
MDLEEAGLGKLKALMGLLSCPRESLLVLKMQKHNS